MSSTSLFNIKRFWSDRGLGDRRRTYDSLYIRNIYNLYIYKRFYKEKVPEVHINLQVKYTALSNNSAFQNVMLELSIQEGKVSLKAAK